jgi:hypothetical protein
MHDKGVILKIILNFTYAIPLKKYVATSMIAERASKNDFAFIKTPDQPLLMCVNVRSNCVGLFQVALQRAA